MPRESGTFDTRLAERIIQLPSQSAGWRWRLQIMTSGLFRFSSNTEPDLAVLIRYEGWWLLFQIRCLVD